MTEHAQVTIDAGLPTTYNYPEVLFATVIGTLRAGGARGLWKTPKHTHTTLTHASGAVDTEKALDARGNAKGKRQANG